jgi:RNA polymerase sigma-70 factor (ECF subfamily)
MPTPQSAPAHFDYASDRAPDHLLALYYEHADTARALASRLLYDRCEAEDVVQDVFLTLWRHPSCFDPRRGTGRAWLLTVVRNRSLDHLRRRGTWQRPREDVSELADQLPDPRWCDAVDELAKADRRELLWRLVDRLPPCQADLIRRSYVSGQTHQEIADATGLPLGTVKSRIRLGLEKLRCGIRTATLPEGDC